MARRRRLLSNQGSYHVCNRAELGAPIFEADTAKQLFLESILAVALRFGWQLHAYAIMTNHFHLFVTTPLGNLSQGMHALQSAFANKHKVFRGSIGHVFQSVTAPTTIPLAPWPAGSWTTSISTRSVPASSRSMTWATTAGPATGSSDDRTNEAS